MGSNVKKPCPKCNKVMRSDHVTRHLKTCNKDKPARIVLANAHPAIGNTSLKKPEHYDPLTRLLRLKVKEAQLDMYLHVYYRTDCFVSETAEQEFLSKFDIMENIFCKCGNPYTVKARPHPKMGDKGLSELDQILLKGDVYDKAYTPADTTIAKRPHAHFIGTWIATDEGHKSRQVGHLFKEKKAFQAKSMGSYGTVKEDIDLIKHFIEAVVYIQTEKGWHKKTEHRNPHTLKHMRDNHAIQIGMFGRWKWAQITYMRYLQKKMQDLQMKLMKANTSEKDKAFKDKIDKLEFKLEGMRSEWMHEDCCTDDALRQSLDEWLNTL